MPRGTGIATRTVRRVEPRIVGARVRHHQGGRDARQHGPVSSRRTAARRHPDRLLRRAHLRAERAELRRAGGNVEVRGFGWGCSTCVPRWPTCTSTTTRPRARRRAPAKRGPPNCDQLAGASESHDRSRRRSSHRRSPPDAAAGPTLNTPTRARAHEHEHEPHHRRHHGGADHQHRRQHRRRPRRGRRASCPRARTPTRSSRGPAWPSCCRRPTSSTSTVWSSRSPRRNWPSRTWPTAPRSSSWAR